MELELKDRIILYNQYEILEKLDEKNKEKYEVYKNILINGFSENYDELSGSFSEELDIEACNFVNNILNLHVILYDSYKKLDEEEKKQVYEGDVSFKGFDPDEEREYYNYAKFEVNNEEKYKELKKASNFKLEADSLSAKTYKDMILKFEEVKDGRHKYLPKDSILAIVNQYNISK